MKKRRIALIGLPGSGKSLFGSLLAKKLQYSFTDTDAQIESSSGLFIPELFARYGETYFRELETLALGRALHKDNCVIATGGGLILSQENRHILQEKSMVVYIRRDCETILKNARMEHRPLLAHNPEYLHNLYAERHTLYEACAHSIVENDDTSEIILERLLEEVSA